MTLCICVGACCFLVYKYVERNIYTDLNNAVESLNEGFVYRNYESRGLTNSISYSEWLKPDYSTINQQNNLLHFLLDFMSTGNNTTFVLGSVFFLFKLSAHHKPDITHFIQNDLYDAYDRIYEKAYETALKASIASIKIAINELGYYNPILERTRLDVIYPLYVREVSSDAFSKCVHLKNGDYKIILEIPANLPHSFTHEEILNELDNVAFSIVSSDSKRTPIRNAQLIIAQSSFD